MKLKISKEIYQAIKSDEVRNERLDEVFSSSWSSETEIDHRVLSEAFLCSLAEYAKKNMDVRHCNAILQGLSIISSISSDVGGKVPKRLDAFKEALVSYIMKDEIDGWIYVQHDNNIILPYLVVDVVYNRATEHNPAHVTLYGSSYQHGRRKDTSFTWWLSDIKKCNNLQQLFNEKNILHETESLKNIYTKDRLLYDDCMNNFGKQYTYISYKDDNSISRSVIKDENGAMRKIVCNDKNILDASKLWTIPKMLDFEDTTADRMLPIHPFVDFFDLSSHRSITLHVTRVTLYKYNKSLIDKLILPEDTKGIIKMLADNSGKNSEDIIKGKTGGTFIISKGIAGTGKTLTAEVYSEFTEKPLYIVQSAQLGLTPKELESNINDILSRAQSWDAILLIDEADVYMRRRSSDLVQNAIVGVWLRTLEYYSGLLMVTTNKGLDIDEAILSRASAIVQYSAPDGDLSHKLWKTLADQYNIFLRDGIVQKLVDKYPLITGRSIKSLLKLAKQMAERNNYEMSDGRQVVLMEDIDSASKYIYINGEGSAKINE